MVLDVSVHPTIQGPRAKGQGLAFVSVVLASLTLIVSGAIRLLWPGETGYDGRLSGVAGIVLGLLAWAGFKSGLHWPTHLTMLGVAVLFLLLGGRAAQLAAGGSASCGCFGQMAFPPLLAAFGATLIALGLVMGWLSLTWHWSLHSSRMAFMVLWSFWGIWVGGVAVFMFAGGPRQHLSEADGAIIEITEVARRSGLAIPLLVIDVRCGACERALVDRLNSAERFSVVSLNDDVPVPIKELLQAAGVGFIRHDTPWRPPCIPF